MQTVLITGVSRGIGKATAEKFLAENYRVIGTTIDGTSDWSHPSLTIIPLDLSQTESVKNCAGQVVAGGQHLNFLINNAGVLFDEEETTLIADKLRTTLEINLIGTADLTEQLISCLAPGAHVVNISSTAGSIELTGQPGSHYPGHYPAYKISKAALNMYTRTLADRLKEQNITVSAVHPGWVQTEIGGEEATLTPAEAAAGIFDRVINVPETGGFWFGRERLPW